MIGRVDNEAAAIIHSKTYQPGCLCSIDRLRVCEPLIQFGEEWSELFVNHAIGVSGLKLDS
jgi:hypothetical protein